MRKKAKKVIPFTCQNHKRHRKSQPRPRPRLNPAPARPAPSADRLIEELKLKSSPTGHLPPRRFGTLKPPQLPKVQHIKIHKQSANGWQGYVGEYHLEDLSKSSDIESFIASDIQPKFGEGKYRITGIDAYGQESDLGSVTALPEPDKVNHPAHYNATSIEPIDVIEAWQLGFHEGNTVKYIARAKLKGNYLEDLKKARWYLNRLIEQLETPGTYKE